MNLGSPFQGSIYSAKWDKLVYRCWRCKIFIWMDESCNLDLLKDHTSSMSLWKENWVCTLPTGFEWSFSSFQFNSSSFPTLEFSVLPLFFFPILSMKYLRSEAAPTPVKGSWWDSSIHLPVGPSKVSHLGERPCYSVAEGRLHPTSGWLLSWHFLPTVGPWSSHNWWFHRWLSSGG